MLNFNLVFLTAAFSVLLSLQPPLKVQALQQQNKLKILVLYESLCSDSRRFMMQFEPVYSEIRDYVDVQLVPFGKSYSESNGAVFYCQHGPAECRGNRLQSCALNAANSTDAQVIFAACQMIAFDGSNIEACAKRAGIPANQQACTNSELGTQLQLEAESITRQYSPTFIPTIVYNDVFDQDLQDRSINDFRGTVCQLLRSGYNIDEQTCVGA